MPNLPIRRVVLYKHGVGYFEREAIVEGYVSLSLAFKQREVSDVLKSLTVLDLDGGTVSAVSYDSTTPSEQLLEEIALSIPDSGSLVGLLPQLKGARTAVTPTGGHTIHGTILGIDTIETQTDTGTTRQVRLSLLTDAADVRTFDLFDLELTLLDEGIKRDLDFYLRTQLASKKKDARAFTLFAQGTGQRTVRVSYVLEAPVWKATYRILLDDSGRAATVRSPVTANTTGDLTVAARHEQPLIQGWAVVDNTSDEDWTDVSLTLVAGLPVSFVHDLYTPRYIRRPVVEVKETTGVLPPMAESGTTFESEVLDDNDDDGSVFELTQDDKTQGGLTTPAASMSMMKREVGGRGGYGGGGGRSTAVSSVQAQTRERQVGDLFEYGIENPVTVRRNQSALVPIVLKPFAGRSVLLYQKAARAENPMRCVEFENTTGLTLEGGPVTVLEQGSYVGEAMLDTMKPTEKRLVGYAVELAVRVLDNIKSYRQHVSRVVIKNGMLMTYYGQVNQTTYTFTSKSSKEQTLYLDHPRNDAYRHGGEWELLDTPTPHEITEHFWRFKFVLPPGVTQFVVKMQQVDSQLFHLSDIADTQLSAWVESRFIDKKTEKVLRDSFEIRHEIAALDEAMRQLASEREQFYAEQKRIRDNLASLGERTSEKELRERFVRTLGLQEDRLEVITRDAKQHQVDRDNAKARLHQTLLALESETNVSE